MSSMAPPAPVIMLGSGENAPPSRIDNQPREKLNSGEKSPPMLIINHRKTPHELSDIEIEDDSIVEEAGPQVLPGSPSWYSTAGANMSMGSIDLAYIESLDHTLQRTVKKSAPLIFFLTAAEEATSSGCSVEEVDRARAGKQALRYQFDLAKVKELVSAALPLRVNAKALSHLFHLSCEHWPFIVGHYLDRIERHLRVYFTTILDKSRMNSPALQAVKSAADSFLKTTAESHRDSIKRWLKAEMTQPFTLHTKLLGCYYEDFVRALIKARSEKLVNYHQKGQGFGGDPYTAEIEALVGACAYYPFVGKRMVCYVINSTYAELVRPCATKLEDCLNELTEGSTA